MPEIANLNIEEVPLDSLSPHPENPRQGDVGAISESLEEHGFYGVIVAQRSTGRILAGNHRWRAAKAKGMVSAPVAWLDVDDDEALRILLADNRTNDLASYDDNVLAELLTRLATDTDRALAGTAYSGDDLDDLLRFLNQPPLAESARTGHEPDLSEFWPEIKVKLSPDDYGRWLTHRSEFDDDSAALVALLPS